jgi:hypothetical protein
MPSQKAKLEVMPSARINGVTLRTIEVYESAYNAQMLDQNHWCFQIAKSVSTPGQSSPSPPNVVWQSKAVAPRTNISWKDQYGLNWTIKLPDPGLSVTLNGEWQACNLGEVFDIGTDGFWTASAVVADKDFMKVGKVGYQYPGVVGLHIVIGIQNSDGGFDTIHVDPVSLALNDTASYKPQEVVTWWYQTGMRTATIISSAATTIGTVDFSTPAPATQKYYYSTTYNYQGGTWITSQDPPPQALYAPPSSVDLLQNPPPKLFSIWPSVWEAVLGVIIGTDKQASVSAGLKSLLKIKYSTVDISFLDDLHIKLELGKPKAAMPNSNDAIGEPDETTEDVISDCFQYLSDDGDLPDGETWKIEKADC